jgi:hypothetical protein
MEMTDAVRRIFDGYRNGVNQQTSPYAAHQDFDLIRIAPRVSGKFAGGG